MRSRHSEIRDILRNLRFGWSSCAISLNVSFASGLSQRYPWHHICVWLLNFPRWGKVYIRRTSSRTNTFGWMLVECYMLRHWTRTIALLGGRLQRTRSYERKYHVVIVVTKNFDTSLTGFLESWIREYLRMLEVWSFRPHWRLCVFSFFYPTSRDWVLQRYRAATPVVCVLRDIQARTRFKKLSYMSASGSDSSPPDGGGSKGKSLFTKLTARTGKDNPYDVSTSQVIHAGPKTGRGDSREPFAHFAFFRRFSCRFLSEFHEIL